MMKTNKLFTFLLIYFCSFIGVCQMNDQDSSLESGANLTTYPWNADVNFLQVSIINYSNGQIFCEFDLDSNSQLVKYTTFFFSGDTAKIARLISSNKLPNERELDDELYNYIYDDEAITFYKKRSLKSVQYKTQHQQLKIGFDTFGNEIYKGLIVEKDTISGLYN